MDLVLCIGYISVCVCVCVFLVTCCVVVVSSMLGDFASFKVVVFFFVFYAHFFSFIFDYFNIVLRVGMGEAWEWKLLSFLSLTKSSYLFQILQNLLSTLSSISCDFYHFNILNTYK